MPSPFPGMNPYLETANGWRDFHSNFLVTMQRALAKLLAGRYIVNCEVRVTFRDPADDESLAGIAVADIGVSPEDGPRPGGVATLAAPVRLTIPLMAEEERDRWLEVVEADTRRVVTVIEFLSPSNKTAGRGREEYLAKRRQLFRSDAHFVEIDLLRGGRRPAPPAWPACDYGVLVSRVEDRPAVDFWPVGLRDRLPVIPVPLLTPDAAAAVDLQALLDTTYDEAVYEGKIYRRRPEPPLPPDDAAWAAGFVPPGRGREGG